MGVPGSVLLYLAGLHCILPKLRVHARSPTAEVEEILGPRWQVCTELPSH